VRRCASFVFTPSRIFHDSEIPHSEATAATAVRIDDAFNATGILVYSFIFNDIA
jgi:hypothetical protein